MKVLKKNKVLEIIYCPFSSIPEILIMYYLFTSLIVAFIMLTFFKLT